MSETDGASDLPELLTTAEVARWLRLTPRAVRDRAREGLLPAVHDGSRWLFQREALREWLDDPPRR